jgi:EmrB/QacA subfamily drug resistance transporter
MEPDRKWWTLGAVCVAIFMLLLDVTIVNVALPDIQKDLGSSFSDLQWVIDAYALTLAAALLTAGSLADLLGRKRVFVIGLVVFTAASALCGLAGSPLMLNLARGIQGVGGAIMFACSLALIAQEFQGRERGTAFGIFGATTGAAVAIGPLVGGALTEGLSWRWIFFVNVPIGLAAIAISIARLRETRDDRGARVDVPGLLTFSAALFLLVFALVRGNDKGWGSTQILALLAASAVLLAAFIAIERRTRFPMFDLSLFRKPSFTGAAIIAFAQSASAFSMFLYLTLYLQNILGYGPLETGLRFLPSTVLSFIVAPIAGKLSARLPVRALMGTGLVLVGVGLLLMTGLDASSSWTALLPGFIVQGAGIGMINPPLASTQIGVVPPQRSGMASGIGNTFRQVGIATGIAGLGAVFQHQVAAKTISALGANAHLLGAGAGNALSSGQAGRLLAHVPAGQRQAVGTALKTGFTGALNELLVIAAVVAFVGAAAAFVLVRGRDFVAHAAAGAPSPAAAAA